MGAQAAEVWIATVVAVLKSTAPQRAFSLDPGIIFLDLGPNFIAQIERPEAGDIDVAGVELLPLSFSAWSRTG